MDYETEDMVVMEKDGVVIVRFRLETMAGLHENDRIQAEINAMLARGVRKLVLDFKMVRFISSATLGTMIATQKAMKELKGQLVISHPENLHELLEVSKTAKLFTTASDARTAVKMLTAP